MSSRYRLVSAVAILMKLSSAQDVEAQTYQIVEIPPVQPQAGPAVTGINQAGVVCGISGHAPTGTDFYGFFYAPGSGSTRLPKLVDGGPQYVGEVRAINDAGVMVGGGSDSNFVNTALSTSTANPSVLVRLPRIAGSSATDAWGVNNSGVIVGWTDDHFDTCTGPFCPNNPGRPIRWTNGAIDFLPTLGGYGGLATAINNPGDVVGIDAFLPNPDVRNTRAFLVPAAGVIAIPLANPFGGSGGTRTYRIKDTGIIPGMADDTAGFMRPVLWTSPSQAGALGMIDGQPHGIALDALPSGTIAVGTVSSVPLNLQGVISGFVPVGGKAAVFVGSRGLDLNALIPSGGGWILRMANVINTQGQIAGTGQLGSEFRAFVLNPCGPLILDQPQPHLTCASSSPSFSVSTVSPVTGLAEATSLVWQWRPQGNPTWTSVVNGPNNDPETNQPAFHGSGAGTSTIGAVNATPGRTSIRREFRVLAGNSCGTTTSGIAIWNHCPADFDCSGSLGVADVFAYLNAWFGGDPETDWDTMPGLQVSDVFAFLSVWFAGC